MKSFFKFKIVLSTAIIGLLFSCKNQDGYSDEILTNENPSQNYATITDSIDINNSRAGLDSAGSVAGSTNTGAASLKAGDQNALITNPGNGGGQSAGNGNGPAESIKDGAVKETPTEAQNFVPTPEKKNVIK